MRETFTPFSATDIETGLVERGYIYKASPEDHHYKCLEDTEKHYGRKLKWQSPYGMPRKASRITLEITNVRVERLQDITDDDAKAEGFAWKPGDYQWLGMTANVSAFAKGWNSINGKGAWELNPWVWVIELKRVNTPSGTCKGEKK